MDFIEELLNIIYQLENKHFKAKTAHLNSSSVPCYCTHHNGLRLTFEFCESASCRNNLASIGLEQAYCYSR